AVGAAGEQRCRLARSAGARELDACVRAQQLAGIGRQRSLDLLAIDDEQRRGQLIERDGSTRRGDDGLVEEWLGSHGKGGSGHRDSDGRKGGGMRRTEYGKHCKVLSPCSPAWSV